MVTGIGPTIITRVIKIPEEAKMLLEHHVQVKEDDAPEKVGISLSKVEMPLGEFFELFPVSYPFNLSYSDETGATRPVANGFSKQTNPQTVNFYLKTLAELSGMSNEEALSCVKNNGVSFEKTTVEAAMRR